MKYDELIKNVNTVQTTDTDTKITETEKINHHNHSNSYISTSEFSRLTAESFGARSKEENLATKADIDELVKKADFDDKLNNLINWSKNKSCENIRKRIQFFVG